MKKEGWFILAIGVLLVLLGASFASKVPRTEIMTSYEIHSPQNELIQNFRNLAVADSGDVLIIKNGNQIVAEFYCNLKDTELVRAQGYIKK